jgi:hypothetical protein
MCTRTPDASQRTRLTRPRAFAGLLRPLLRRFFVMPGACFAAGATRGFEQWEHSAARQWLTLVQQELDLVIEPSKLLLKVVRWASCPH